MDADELGAAPFGGVSQLTYGEPSAPASSGGEVVGAQAAITIHNVRNKGPRLPRSH